MTKPLAVILTVACVACGRGRLNYSPVATPESPCDGRRVLAVYNNTTITLQVFWALPTQSVSDVNTRGAGMPLGAAQPGTTYFGVPGPGSPFVRGDGVRPGLYRLSYACETTSAARQRAA